MVGEYRPSPPAPLPAARPDPRERGAREIHRHRRTWLKKSGASTADKPQTEMRLELEASPLPGVRVCGWERGRG